MLLPDGPPSYILWVTMHEMRYITKFDRFKGSTAVTLAEELSSITFIKRSSKLQVFELR